MDRHYDWIDADVTYAAGIPGQGTANPASIFVNHALAIEENAETPPPSRHPWLRIGIIALPSKDKPEASQRDASFGRNTMLPSLRIPEGCVYRFQKRHPSGMP